MGLACGLLTCPKSPLEESPGVVHVVLWGGRAGQLPGRWDALQNALELLGKSYRF